MEKNQSLHKHTAAIVLSRERSSAFPQQLIPRDIPSNTSSLLSLNQCLTSLRCSVTQRACIGLQRGDKDPA